MHPGSGPGHLAAVAAACLLATTFALVLGAGAAAQTSVTLVSNTGQSTASEATLANDVAQEFTTGSDTFGYRLTSVDISFGGNASPSHEVRIHAWSSQLLPGNSLGTLSGSSSTLSGTVTFNASGTGIELSSGTKYFVVFDATASSSEGTTQHTRSNSEDASAAAGWSIGNSSLFRGWSADSWSGSSSDSLKIAIKGYGKSRPPSKPFAPRVSAGTSPGSLSVRWEGVSDDGSSSVKDFDLRYYAGSADPTVPADWVEEGEAGGHTHTGTFVEATITGLSADTAYRVQVRAENNEGEGPWSSSGGATTAPPRVSSVSIVSTPTIDTNGDNTPDTYGRDDRIAVQVTFDGAVTVTPTHTPSTPNTNVRLRLDVGEDDTTLNDSQKVLRLHSASGATLRFEYTVKRTDEDPDGVWVQTGGGQVVFLVGGATLTGTATGRDAVRTKSGLPTRGDAGHKVDGARGVPEITISGGTAVTEGTAAEFTVTASPAPASNLTVNLAVSESVGSDYVASADEGAKTVTIAANTTSATWSVPTQGDSVDEPNGTVTVQVATGAAYTVGATSSADVTVNDDDIPEITISGGTAVTEGTAAEFTVTASPVPASNLTVNLAVSESTGSDYVASADEGAKTVTIAANTASATWSVPTQGDTTDEPNGTVTVTVGSGTGYTVGTTSSADVAVNDDDVPEITISGAAAVSEGTAAEFTVTASVAPASDLTVNLAVSESVGSDYVASADEGAKTVTISANTTSAPYSVPTQDDTTDEPNGTVTVRVTTGTGYTVGTTSSAHVAVNDDDGAAITTPEITISGAAAVTEGTPAGFTVTASPAPASDLTVNLAVSESAGSDYVAPGDEGAKTVTIAANATSAPWSVPTQGDSVDEPNGSVTVQVATGTGYTVGTTNFARVAVNDDDDAPPPPPPPPITPSVPAITISGGTAVTEGTAAEFTVTANPAPASDLAVNLTVSESAGSDYVAPGDEGAKTVTINANAATTTWSVPTQGDGVDEPNGTVTVQVVAGTGYTVGRASSAGVAVNDDDDDDATPPGLRGAVASGTTLTLVFDEALDTSAPPPAPSAFSVAGTERPVRVVAVAFHASDATRVELTLSRAVIPGPGVAVSYVRPFDNPLRDRAGNEVTGWANAPVKDRLIDLRVHLAPAAAHPWAQGFVRVLNHSGEGGAASILAIDDAGVEYGPVTLDLDAHHTVHFNSGDLEAGNAGKGLASGVGPPGQGSWRLELESKLDLEVLSYIRTEDGFVTSMHDLVPGDEAGGYRVVFFNPGSNRSQVSRLRLTNPGEAPVAITIAGTDDAGKAGESEVEFTLAAGASRSVTAQALELGDEGLVGRLGDGKGKWRLDVIADWPIRVMSLLQSPTGHLSNLSATVRKQTTGTAAVSHRVPLVPSASDPLERQGFVRVINHSGEASEVSITAIDDAGVEYDPVQLAIDAHQTLHFNSADLEQGNARKGLRSGTGAGEGDWRLVLTSTLDLEVLSYIRTEDGFVTSMHEVAPASEAGHRVVFVNPASNRNQVSWLRLVNPGEAPADITITGTDDAGEAGEGPVHLTLAPRASRMLSAQALESGQGEDLSGRLGDGKGKWRLQVRAPQPIRVMSLLASPTGHLTNLSAAPGRP